MRTSFTQFKLLVEYMERHGDLSQRNVPGSRGPFKTHLLWEQLVMLLNKDKTGNVKSVVKWKKVWSDLKNNTKRKAARYSVAVNDPSRGPPVALTDIEQRVMKMLGARGTSSSTQEASVIIDNPEDGLNENKEFLQSLVSDTVPVEEELTPQTSDADMGQESSVDEWNQSESTSKPILRVKDPMALLAPQRILDVKANEAEPVTRQRHHLESRRRPVLTPLHRRKHIHTQQCCNRFDNEWRSFQNKMDRRENERERERLRLREIELQQQVRWQDLFAKFLTVMDKVVDKFGK